MPFACGGGLLLNLFAVGHGSRGVGLLGVHGIAGASLLKAQRQRKVRGVCDGLAALSAGVAANAAPKSVVGSSLTEFLFVAWRLAESPALLSVAEPSTAGGSADTVSGGFSLSSPCAVVAGTGASA